MSRRPREYAFPFRRESAPSAAPSRRSGSTVLELSIGVALLVVLLIALGELFLRTSRAMSSIGKSAHVATRSPIVMDRIVSELISGRFASMDPPLAEQSDRIRFQKVIESGSPPVYGNPIQIELVADEADNSDGLDNDKDGLVDESALRIWEDFAPYAMSPGAEDAPYILATNLTSDGLKFTREEAVLLIEMTFQAVIERGDKPTLYRLQSGVRMRNSD